MQKLLHIVRTNIDIDDLTLDAAMRAGPFKTKKDAVDAGLKLLARQAAYREILKWEGKLPWDGDDEPDADAPPAMAMAAGHPPRALAAAPARPLVANEPAVAYRVAKAGRGRR